jgi:hypothetical protein
VVLGDATSAVDVDGAALLEQVLEVATGDETSQGNLGRGVRGE